MDTAASFVPDDEGQMVLKEGTGGSFSGGLRPGVGLVLACHMHSSQPWTAAASRQLC